MKMMMMSMMMMMQKMMMMMMPMTRPPQSGEQTHGTHDICSPDCGGLVIIII